MQYIKVDENGDLIPFKRIFASKIEVAADSGVAFEDYNESTFEVPSNYQPVTLTQLPDNLTKYQFVSGVNYAKNTNGEWVQEFIIETVSDERKQVIDGLLTIESRNNRNVLLTNSDWTQLPDAPLTPEKKVEWATYRQALRDITNQPEFPVYHKYPMPPQ